MRVRVEIPNLPDGNGNAALAFLQVGQKLLHLNI